MDFPSLPTYFFYSWTIFVKNCWQRLWLLPTSEDHGSNPVVGRRKRKRGRERPILKYLYFWLEQVFFAAVALTRDLSLAGTSAVSVEQCPTTLLYSMELLTLWVESIGTASVQLSSKFGYHRIVAIIVCHGLITIIFRLTKRVTFFPWYGGSTRSSESTKNLLLNWPRSPVQRDRARSRSSCFRRCRNPLIASTNDRKRVPWSFPPTLKHNKNRKIK